MKLLDNLVNIKNELTKSNARYIRSTYKKNLIYNFYKKVWLPLSENFKKDFGLKSHNLIESNAKKMYELAKKDYFVKDDMLHLLRNIENILEEIEFDLIRRGSVIEMDEKKEILDLLNKFTFSKTIEYINKSEEEFSQNKWKESCYQTRLAIEEFFRKIREVVSNSSIQRGTCGEHLDYLQNKNLISFSERKLVQYGFYAFLSEKGDHATKEIIDEIDAKISIYIFYILVEYFIQKMLNQKIL